jgi:TatD DNase family protein
VIDTHCHLTFPDFAGVVPQTLAEARRVGVDRVITISTTTQDAVECLHVAKAHEGVYCSAGVHPGYADRGPHNWAELGACIAHAKCLAWGELGLDNHYPTPDKGTQLAVLHEQLEFIAAARGRGVDKPIILHCREAFDELVPILRASGLDTRKMVFHCFTGTPADMRLLLDIGAMVSFTGVVTYKNAQGVREALALAPLERIMIETDAPFLPPEPVRGQRPCTPAMSRITAEFVAREKGVSWDAFHAQINANCSRFFGIT